MTAMPTCSNHRHFCGVAVAMLLMAGCGGDRIPISGAVTFDGEPVLTGAIVFEPTDEKGKATGARIVDGRYELAGEAAPEPGKKKVRITASRKTGRRIQAAFSPPGTLTDEIEPYLPDVYNTRSTLTCDVAPDQPRQIDFHLKRP